MENVRARQTPKAGGPDIDTPKLDAYVAGIRGQFEDRLGHMVEIPTVSDCYFGRDSTDDKGPGITALFAAKYAADNGIPLNIRFI
jgi:acetylornithine deacetylase/succinyl-diaminopimelate desuccinylase-like protein